MDRRAGMIAVVLAGLGACAGCTREGETEPQLRLVLITLDTLRYDAVAGTSSTPSAMPRLLARAEQGAHFSRFYAATSTTQYDPMPARA